MWCSVQGVRCRVQSAECRVYVETAGEAAGAERACGFTGVPRSSESPPPQDPTVGLCIGPEGAPRGCCFLMREIPL